MPYFERQSYEMSSIRNDRKKLKLKIVNQLLNIMLNYFVRKNKMKNTGKT